MRNRLMAIVVAAALVVVAATAVYATDFAVIVHSGNPTKAMTLADLGKIFRGKTTAWPNGHGIALVVRDPNSARHEVHPGKSDGRFRGRGQGRAE